PELTHSATRGRPAGASGVLGLSASRRRRAPARNRRGSRTGKPAVRRAARALRRLKPRRTTAAGARDARQRLLLTGAVRPSRIPVLAADRARRAARRDLPNAPRLPDASAPARDPAAP